MSVFQLFIAEYFLYWRLKVKITKQELFKLIKEEMEEEAEVQEPQEEMGQDSDPGDPEDPADQALAIWQQMLYDEYKKLGGTLQEAEKPDLQVSPFREPAKSAFCKYNPQINQFAVQNSDNFAETLLFVYGTMRTPWPKFAPYFRFIIDIKESGYDIEKLFDKDNREELSSTIRKMYLDKTGVEESSLNKKQKNYLAKAVSNLVLATATPSKKFYDFAWSGREALFNHFAPLLERYQKNKNPSDLFKLFFDLQQIGGLGNAKAGFAVQLMTGQMGCVDSVWTKVLKGSDPELSRVLKSLENKSGKFRKGKETEPWMQFAREPEPLDKKTGNPTTFVYKTAKDKAQQYANFLKSLESSTGLDSQKLWDAWIEQVTRQTLRPTGKTIANYSLVDADGKVILADNNYKYIYHSPVTSEKKPSVNSPYYMETFDLEDPEELKNLVFKPGDVEKLFDQIGKEHLPSNLQLYKENTKLTKEVLMRTIMEVLKEHKL